MIRELPGGLVYGYGGELTRIFECTTCWRPEHPPRCRLPLRHPALPPRSTETGRRRSVKEVARDQSARRGWTRFAKLPGTSRRSSGRLSSDQHKRARRRAQRRRTDSAPRLIEGFSSVTCLFGVVVLTAIIVVDKLINLVSSRQPSMVMGDAHHRTVQYSG